MVDRGSLENCYTRKGIRGSNPLASAINYFMNHHPKVKIKAIIFDWGRTLFDSETKLEYPEAEPVLQECKNRGYILTVASLVSPLANATLSERTSQIESSPLRKFFTIALTTETDKDEILKQIVTQLQLPADEIMIVDDRTIRGISYGNKHGHPTAWLKQGRFANELPNTDTGLPTFTIKSLSELLDIV